MPKYTLFEKAGSWLDRQINKLFYRGQTPISEAPPEKPDKIEYFSERKAYICWYSGLNYDVRREISCVYWLRDGETLPYDIITTWLDRACKEAFGHMTGFYDVQTWHGSHYEVTGAMTGKVFPDISNYEYSRIQYEYTKNNKLVKGGNFMK